VILERFGDYVFPIYNVNDTLSAVARSDMFATPMGGFDPNGSENAADRPGTITRRCEICEPHSSVAFQTALDAARALRGKRAKLWARTAGESEVRWLWGRCQSIGVQRSERNHHYQEIIYTFNVPHFGWNGRGYSDWALDDGTFLDTGFYLDTGSYRGDLVSTPDSFVITNGGNRTVTNIILDIHAGAVNMTSIVITLGDAYLTFAGPVLAGNHLLIDTGSYIVTNGAVNSYSGLVLHANHAIDDWLRLEPGDNTLEIAWAGGSTGSEYELKFWDGWY
jgi:hypothetical protein